jgi:environmental stress-induced protein Ves
MLFRLRGSLELRQTRWAGGVTTELAISPATATLEERNFLCRISASTVEQDAPFSDFSGYERILMLLFGQGLELSIAGKRTVLTSRFQLIRFPGDAKVDVKILGGPIMDFNVIFRKAANAQVRTVALGNQPLTIFEAPDHTPSMKRLVTVYSPYASFTAVVDGNTVQGKPKDVLEVECLRAKQTSFTVMAADHTPEAAAIVVSYNVPE